MPYYVVPCGPEIFWELRTLLHQDNIRFGVIELICEHRNEDPDSEEQFRSQRQYGLPIRRRLSNSASSWACCKKKKPFFFTDWTAMSNAFLFPTLVEFSMNTANRG
jgi:hypothetical protein